MQFVLLNNMFAEWYVFGKEQGEIFGNSFSIVLHTAGLFLGCSGFDLRFFGLCLNYSILASGLPRWIVFCTRLQIFLFLPIFITVVLYSSL